MHPQVGRGAAERRVTAASLHRIPLFREVSEDVLAPLAAISDRQVLGPDDILWHPNDSIDAIFALAMGGVRLYRNLDSGQEVTTALLGPGQVCGLASLSTEFRPTTVAGVLVVGTMVYRIPRQSFAQFLLANPDVALRALAITCQRIQDAYDLLTLLDARARVAYVLVHLAAINGGRTVWATREELAALARVSREDVTRRLLPHLLQRGLIAYEQHHRGIRVLDSTRLLSLSTCKM